MQAWHYGNVVLGLAASLTWASNINVTYQELTTPTAYSGGPTDFVVDGGKLRTYWNLTRNCPDTSIAYVTREWRLLSDEGVKPGIYDKLTFKTLGMERSLIGPSSLAHNETVNRFYEANIPVGETWSVGPLSYSVVVTCDDHKFGEYRSAYVVFNPKLDTEEQDEG